jgi:hypothetical protein
MLREVRVRHARMKTVGDWSVNSSNLCMSAFQQSKENWRKGKSVERGKNVNWTVSAIDGMKRLDDSATVIVTGIGMAVATRATATALVIPAISTGIGAVIETIVMTAHATSTVAAPTVIALVPGIASTMGSAHDLPLPRPAPHHPHPLQLLQFPWFPNRLQHPRPLPSLPRRLLRT